MTRDSAGVGREASAPAQRRSAAVHACRPTAGSRPIGSSSLWDPAEPAGPQPLKASWDPVGAPPSETEHPRPARPVRSARRRSGIGWFVHRYGWRAYTLPVLVAVTVLVVLQLTSVPRPAPTGPAGAQSASSGTSQDPATVTASVPTTVTVEQAGPTSTINVPVAPATTIPAGPTVGDPNGAFAANLPAGSLPPGGAFAVTGAGTWHTVPGTTPVLGTGAKHFTYTVDVENGIETPAADQEFAAAVDAILADPRSWIGGGEFTLQRIEAGNPSFRISLTSQMSTRAAQNCGWSVPLEGSCYNKADGRVFINIARWIRGAVSYNGDLGSYRVYAVNHEVGHALGYHHEACPANGGLAPVMMQQSWSVANDDLAPLGTGPVTADGKVCKPNPFPYPRGARPAGSAARG